MTGNDRRNKMNRTIKTRIPLFVLLVGMLLLSGCGEKTCFFLTKDADGVQAGAPVVWYNAFVGKVASVGTEEEAARVEIAFEGRYANAIHDGVAARVVADLGISPRPFVLLVGGKDESRPLLGSGVQIPESRPGNAVQEGFTAFVDWLRTSRPEELKVVVVLLVVLVILCMFVRRVIRLALIAGIAGLIAYAVLSTRSEWDNYRNTFENAKALSAEAKDWVLQHGDKLQVVLESAEESRE